MILVNYMKLTFSNSDHIKFPLSTYHDFVAIMKEVVRV